MLVSRPSAYIYIYYVLNGDHGMEEGQLSPIFLPWHAILFILRNKGSMKEIKDDKKKIYIYYVVFLSSIIVLLSFVSK